MIMVMFCMVLLTFFLGGLALKARYQCVSKREISIKYFQTMVGDVPERIRVTTRCYNNMFEIPILFYVVATLHLVFEIENMVSLALAWSFFGLRVLQAYIHLTKNNIIHRMQSYWMGCFCVLLLWLHALVLIFIVF